LYWGGVASIGCEHGVDVVGVRRSVACGGITALQRAAKQLPDVAAPSVTAAEPRSSDSRPHGLSVFERLARCQRARRAGLLKEPTMTARVRLYASADHEVSGATAAAAQAGAWLVASRRALVCQPILKPIREPLHCVEGPVPGFPCKCTPCSPVVCLTTIPPRCCVRVVKQSTGEAEQMQGKPGAGVASSSGDQEGEAGRGGERGWRDQQLRRSPTGKAFRLRVREALLHDWWARQREEPLRLAMGWSEMLAYDHVRRLVGAGLGRRVR